MAVCPACNTQTGEGQNFCFKCGSSLQTTTSQLQSGTILENRYKVIEPLGNGGMGAVYLAQDSRLNDSLIAVKEMKVKDLSKEELEVAIKAFKKEASLLIDLRHSALPRVVDFFLLETEAGI